MVLRLHPSFYVAPEPFHPHPVTQLVSQPRSAEAAASLNNTNEPQPQEGKQLKPAETAASVNNTKESQMVKCQPFLVHPAPLSLRKGWADSRKNLPSKGRTSRLSSGYWNSGNTYIPTPISSKHTNGHAPKQPGPMKTSPEGTIRDLVFRIARNIDGVPRSLCIFRTTFKDQELWERYLEYINQVIADAVRAFNATPDYELHIHGTPLTLDKMEHQYFQDMPLSLVRSFFLTGYIKAGPSVLEDYFICADEDALETFRTYDAFRRRYPPIIQNVFGSHPPGAPADHVTVHQVDAAARGIRDMAGRHRFARGVVPEDYPTLRASSDPVEERRNMHRLCVQLPFIIFEALPEEEKREDDEQEASAG